MKPMKGSDGIELLLLAAIWGASFMFMRMSAAEFGPLTLAGVRVAGAALMLMPLLAWRGEWTFLRSHAWPIAVVGVLGSAIPFMMYAVAALAVPAGVASIVNATTPIWGALIVWLWLGESMTPTRAMGLAVGLAGVAWLAWSQQNLGAPSTPLLNPVSASQASTPNGLSSVGPLTAIGACLVATLCYGFVAVFTKRRLSGVPPMAVATGSQMAAALVLMVPAIMSAPNALPSTRAWGAAVALAVICTGLAYVLYFRLIARLGAARATNVTFLIPIFAVLWGWSVLGEPLSIDIALACAAVLLGTALSLGLFNDLFTAKRGGADRS